MSPRANRRRRDEPAPPAAAAHEQVEDFGGEPWVVRSITGSSSTKPYRCPGCDQEIRPATPHVVAWPQEPAAGGVGLERRRHWHRACWRARETRRPRA